MRHVRWCSVVVVNKNSMLRFLHHNRVHFITALLVLLSLFMLFGTTHTAFAQEGPIRAGATAPPPVTDSSSFGASVGLYIGNFILTIASGVTWMGAQLLDASINYFILQIGTLIADGSSIGNAITNAWVMIRDICNLAFIFGFIYLGIRTILDSDNSNTKRMLASIIIGALLINFSLFFAKIIIDIVAERVPLPVMSELYIATAM